MPCRSPDPIVTLRIQHADEHPGSGTADAAIATHTRRVFSLVRPRLVDIVVLSLPMPTSLWKGENPVAGTKFKLKLVADADDPDLAKHEPRWRLRQCRKDFARGAWCILAIDTEIDEPIGILWAATETRGLNPLGGPYVRLAADEIYVYALWVDQRYRRTGVGLALAAEYTAQQAVRASDVNWLHVMVEAENEASISLLIDGWHMWVSQRGKLLKFGGSVCVLVPGTATPRFGPFSRRGRHSGHGLEVPGKPPGWTHAAGEVFEPTPSIAEVCQALTRGPDWEGID